jgi:hypothetical protein
LGRVADQEQVGAVRARAEERVREFHVQHGRLVHDHDVGLQWPVLAAGERGPHRLTVLVATSLRAEQPVDGRRGRAAQLL